MKFENDSVVESAASAVGIGGGGIRQRHPSQLKAVFSRSAMSVRPDRDIEREFWAEASDDDVGQGLPRHEMRKDSSLFFFVCPYPSAGEVRRQYYDCW